jgi:S-adenosylmethionine:tRNA ribosyltransferase-isomerase
MGTTSDHGTHSPFTYELPAERIAQRPVHPADTARLMAIDRASEQIRHLTFRDLPALLRPDDHLVFNDTRVLPARFFGVLSGKPESRVELLLLREESPHRWLCIGRPLRKIRSASSVVFSDRLSAEVVGSPSPDRVVIEFRTNTTTPIEELVREHGSMPIPPYIRDGHADEQDAVDYQTIFADKDGSVAAPTASLHFTPELLDDIRDKAGCSISRITLHVGSASFLPIFVDGVLRPPGSEQFSVPASILESLLETRARGGRVIAVGTTVVRALESAVRSGGSASMQDTQLFIQPGFQFQVVSTVITNFHQPGTTHLLLVEALLGKELLTQAYHAGLEDNYRFLSYGDGMVIL